MSRIGKKAIEVPKDVLITLNQDKVIVKGIHGTLERMFGKNLNVNLEENKLVLTRNDETKKTREYHGLMRALIQNMVTGVTEKFSKTLIAEGVGYKFQVDKTNLVVNVGYTHPIEFPISKELLVKLETPTKITISGIDKEQVGFLAAQIRDTRPPEPYKGKGILYDGEKIRRKAGKTGK
jgi:large subunit ribosomal protein L6